MTSITLSNMIQCGQEVYKVASLSASKPTKEAIMSIANECKVNSCDKPIYVKKERLCNSHYIKYRRFGNYKGAGRKYTAHGLYKHPLYVTWSNMIARCTKKYSARYSNYGGRGITVCDRWQESFANFLEDVGEKPDENHTLDRIDNNGNYEPSNVRWATLEQQAANQGKRWNNKTGITGVSWDKRRSKWRAVMFINGKQTELGSFNNIEEAVKARNKAEKERKNENSTLSHI